MFVEYYNRIRQKKTNRIDFVNGLEGILFPPGRIFSLIEAKIFFQILSNIPFDTLEEVFALQQHCISWQAKLDAISLDDSCHSSVTSGELCHLIDEFLIYIKKIYGLNDNNFRQDIQKSQVTLKRISSSPFQPSTLEMEPLENHPDVNIQNNQNGADKNQGTSKAKRKKSTKLLKKAKPSIKWFTSAIISDVDSTSETEENE